MADQRGLFDAPYVKHSETSKAAAREIEPTLNELQRKVRDFFIFRGDHGATDEEIQLTLEMNPSTERPRRRELQVRGIVFDSGIKRKTKSGRAAVVWKIEQGGDDG